jgi:hypothetical protein
MAVWRVHKQIPFGNDKQREGNDKQEKGMTNKGKGMTNKKRE